MDIRYFFVWIVLVLSGCGGEDRSLVTDRFHDLVAMIDKAELGEGSSLQPQPAGTIQGFDNRDGLAFFLAEPGAPIVFRDLYTRGRAVLEFGCGVAHLKKLETSSGSARFRIEAGNKSDQPMHVIFEKELNPSDLPPDPLYLNFRKELADEGEAEWTLRFSLDAVDASMQPEWCGWIAPRLSSEGRTVDLESYPVERLKVHIDLIGTLGDSEVVKEAPENPVRIDFHDSWKDNPILGGRRSVIEACASSRIRYTVTPQRSYFLDFAVGMDSDRGWSRPGDGMTFAVEIDGSQVWSLHLDPRDEKAHRGWKHAKVDLGPWAGRCVEIDLVTEPGPDKENDVGGWSQAFIFERVTVPRLTSEQAPTVLLVVAETLRADHLGAYGNELGLTPRLDAMAKESVLFTRAWSSSSWTWPAVGSILTGLYPNSHGIKEKQYSFLVDPIETVAELFADRGYTTGAFISNMLISRDNNFHQGFETFVLTPNATARALNDRVTNWLDNTQGLARFAFIHYFDPHTPYHPPRAFAPAADPEIGEYDMNKIKKHMRQMAESGRADKAAIEKRYIELRRNLYAAEVAYLDAAFGEFMEAIKARGLLENCIIVFTADHGEEFMEHGFVGHGNNLFNETVSVPLWISGHGGAALDPGIITDPVETKDIIFTLCELTGTPAPRNQPSGKSLLQGGSACRFSQTLMGREPGIKGFTEIQAVTRGPWKLIHAPASNRTRLYNLEMDPGETRDQAAEYVEKRDAMLKILKAWDKSTRALAPDSRIGNVEEMEERLRALGYIGN
jgi:arylsulfatase